MGRPLKEKTMEKLNLEVTLKDENKVVLGKQVGYNKYKASIPGGEIIVRLVDVCEDNIEGIKDCILPLYIQRDEEDIKEVHTLKITDKLFYTTDGCYMYKLTENNVIDFSMNPEGVSLEKAEEPAVQAPARSSRKAKQPVEETPVVEEPTEEVVEETPVVEEPTEEVVEE